MNAYKKIIAFIMILSLTAGLLFTGCGTDTTVKEPIEYDFSVFFGSMDDAMEIDALLTEYEEKTGVKIEPIIISDGKDYVNALESLLEDEEPPAAYAASSDVDLEYLSEGGFIADFSDIDSGVQGDSFPYVMDGYGLAYDRTMFEEIFGKTAAGKLINDLKKAEYDEWNDFVEALDNYIKGRSNYSFSVRGNVYKFPDKKGQLTRSLNGVFAIPGADNEIYGYDLMGLVTQNVDLSAWMAVKNQPSGPALQILDPALTTYINGLDLLTSYLSGVYSSGIRGSDFVNEEYYSNDKTRAMFMEGKAMFSVIDSREYTDLEQLNAKKAQTLEYLPIKMPYDSSLGGKSSTGAILNSSIPAEVAYTFYVNGKCSSEIQEEALDFLTWFTAQEDKWIDPLSASIKTYVEEDDILEYDYRPDELESWEEEIFGEEGVRLFLRKEVWSEEYKDEMKLYLTEFWCES